MPFTFFLVSVISRETSHFLAGSHFVIYPPVLIATDQTSHTEQSANPSTRVRCHIRTISTSTQNASIWSLTAAVPIDSVFCVLCTNLLTYLLTCIHLISLIMLEYQQKSEIFLHIGRVFLSMGGSEKSRFVIYSSFLSKSFLC